jgi:transcriptional regulator with XRE-family HTH domain
MRLRIAELARLKKGWNMKKVAEKMDVEHQTILYWNQGRSYPRLPVLLRLCRLLECSIDDLLNE